MNNYDGWIIYCAGYYGEKAMLMLHGLGEKVHCFLDNDPDRHNEMCWDMRVYSFEEARREYPAARIMISNQSWKNSLLIAEHLETIGCVEGTDYEIALKWEAKGVFNKNSLKKGLSAFMRKYPMIVGGDNVMIRQFVRWFTAMTDSSPIICSDEKDIGLLHSLYPEAIWTLLRHGLREEDKATTEKLLNLYRYNGIIRFSRYFLYNYDYCEEQEEHSESTICEKYGVIVEKVVCVYESSFSGTLLLNNIMDFHPNILFLEYAPWGWDVWYFIKSISDSINVADDVILQLYKYSCGWDVEKIERFRFLLREYFGAGKRYAEKDIMIGIYLAYYQLIHNASVKGRVWIYVDAHSTAALTMGGLITWMIKMGIEPVLVKSVRNPIKRSGSTLNYLLKENPEVFKSYREILPDMLIYWGTEERNPWGVKEIVFRFEDIKLHPKQVICALINQLNIPWNDSLLNTTLDGKEFMYQVGESVTTGFDLKPVWNEYDDFFNEFDKMRLGLLFCEKKKAYGYSYTPRSVLPKQLLEINGLFACPWKIESFFDFSDDDEIESFRHAMQIVGNCLCKMGYQHALYKFIFEFSDYLTIELQQSI